MTPLEFLVLVEKTIRKEAKILPELKRKEYYERMDHPSCRTAVFYDGENQKLIVSQDTRVGEFIYGVEKIIGVKIPKNILDENVEVDYATPVIRGFLRFPMDGVRIDGIICTENFNNITNLDFIVADYPIGAGDYISIPTKKGENAAMAVKKCVKYGYKILSKCRNKDRIGSFYGEIIKKKLKAELHHDKTGF